MSVVGLAVSGNGLFRVTLTQDDVLHRWTAIHVVNQDAKAWTVYGDFNGTPFSQVSLPGTTTDRAIAVNLIERPLPRGGTAWIPSLNGTTPMAYSIGVSSI